MDKLAMLGGQRAVPRTRRVLPWPQVTDEEEQAVNRALASGRFTVASAGEPEVAGLEREWADFVGTAHCLAVSNGTTALSLALAVAGVQPGDEVIVPALSFIASGLAPLHIGAVPVFVDIDPDTFNVSADTVERAITERTRAIVVVHLHGLPADLDQIMAVADRHGLLVLEDAAQAQGARYHDRVVGSFGLVSSFSLNVAKNLPTCGEGGLINTDDPRLYRRAEMLRQFGETLAGPSERSYVSHLPGWNHKPNAIQCAFARAQLGRFEATMKIRDANVERLLASLAELPGLQVPGCPADRSHAWHILRFRLRPEAFGLASHQTGALRAVMMKALRAEGVPATHYQLMPLPLQRAFGGAASRAEFPQCYQVIEDSFTIQKAHLHPDAGPLLDSYADAFDKVWRHRALIASYAAAAEDVPPWQQADRLADAEAAELSG
ncbi:DegT/DnrJ/EryC1/StrS family aminotransferase [Jatrophihabitans sp.]|uniref:DegT/DnrJ/EryC1/StrS family aminotransferase n=1 Tax=Jatrophihabitans sp. TaxID=1932789 RepID=UPI002BC49758|nr:DegT/DnrJ/EryC1/StrS family aminotransferase [Jatrophihabitans sp.]